MGAKVIKSKLMHKQFYKNFISNVLFSIDYEQKTISILTFSIFVSFYTLIISIKMIIT